MDVDKKLDVVRRKRIRAPGTVVSGDSGHATLRKVVSPWSVEKNVGAGLILVDPPMINGEKYEFQAVRDSQLVKNVREVMLDSLLTDA